MNLYFFTKYGEIAASSRYRSFQYFKRLEQAGYEVKISPLFSNKSIIYKYKTGSYKPFDVICSYTKRLLHVLRLPKFSIVLIEKELLPYLPSFLEIWLRIRRCYILVDYDDALFHQYDKNRFFFVRFFLHSKIANVIKLADLVIAGNMYLANYAKKSNAKNVVIIPTVVDLSRYKIKCNYNTNKLFVIGWIGSPSTARFLYSIAPALAEVCKDGRACVRLVGSGPIDLPGVPIEVIQWNSETEVDEMHQFDVGIMPLPDEPWTRGKCGFKLIQYQACCLPVVASPVGVNKTIVIDGVNGFLADNKNSWVKSLLILKNNFEIRHRFGYAGRNQVQNHYCLDVTAPQICNLFYEIQKKY